MAKSEQELPVEVEESITTSEAAIEAKYNEEEYHSTGLISLQDSIDTIEAALTNQADIINIVTISGMKINRYFTRIWCFIKAEMRCTESCW